MSEPGLSDGRADVDPHDEKAKTRRPPGFVAPGPKPRGAAGRSELLPSALEDLSFLSGDFRILQQKHGHRWSLDDFATAIVAIEEARSRGKVSRFLDLGSGIGSVLMMMAWAFEDACGVGIEAQELSAGMARRSLAFNGIACRVRVISGDLRETSELDLGAPFDLITGTPPYIPIGHGFVSERVQRGPCFFETRGGVESYALSASKHLADGGVFVFCYGGEPVGRGERAAEAAGLEVVRRVDVIPREGKPSLLRVAVARRSSSPGGPDISRFVVRDAEGKLTEQMLQARQLLGMPPPMPR